MKKCLLLSFISVALFSACKEQGKEVSWQTQETQRSIAIENSEYNARQFRQKNKKYSGYNIMGRGDSTIGKRCANGDGWASVDLVDENQQVIKIKCSTASSSIGCMTKVDFSTRKYAAQEGRCNTDLPVPMPRILK